MRVPQKDKRSYFIRERPMTTNINNSPEYACRTCAKQECGCKDTECQLPCHFYTEQAEQEPVAWVSEDVCDGQFINGRKRRIWWECMDGKGMAIYAAPVRTKDLTDEELDALWHGNTEGGWRGLFRAVIAADRERNRG